MAKKTIVSEVASAVGSAAGVAAARVEGLKPKRSTTTKHSKAQVKTPVEIAAPVVDRSEIARIAYLKWEARDGQNGSQEQDWVLAEQELFARSGH